jgi:hypothetical protein
LHALLQPALQNLIRLYSISAEKFKDADSSNGYKDLTSHLQEVSAIRFAELWHEEVRKISRPKPLEISPKAREIMKISPNEIDAVRVKNGETLRFRGLPFARIRRIAGEEKTWFGTDENTRRILSDESFKDFEKLLADLAKNRCPDAPLRRNFLTKSAPEAWLETILRKDVTRLDPNLILAPLHAQLRLTSPPNSLDLLALRTDGRLVVIELKVAPDREFILQAADYWRQVELQRRRGNIAESRLFGDLKILDAPPLVYLVAPLTAFHRDFEKLAGCINKEIEFWRYDLSETWREEIKVARRMRV